MWLYAVVLIAAAVATGLVEPGTLKPPGVDRILVNLSLEAVRESMSSNQTNASGDNRHTAQLLFDSRATVDLTCLRLFTEKQVQGGWVDVCSSNELLTRCSIFHTKSVCAPKDNWWESRQYWLLFEQPEFHGPYLMLMAGECISSFDATPLGTLGSVLKCTQETSSILEPKILCHFPSKPWRHFSHALVKEEAQRDIEKMLKMMHSSDKSGGTFNKKRSKMNVQGVDATVYADEPLTSEAEEDDPSNIYSAQDFSSLKGASLEWRVGENLAT